MTQTRHTFAFVIFIAVVLLGDCAQEEFVERSMLRIGTARTDLYIEKPEGCRPNRECLLFMLDSDERHATRVKAQLGEVAGDLVQVVAGLHAGDRVILNDMSVYMNQQRIGLQR
jgi:hypothetical protein